MHVHPIPSDQAAGEVRAIYDEALAATTDLFDLVERRPATT